MKPTTVHITLLLTTIRLTCGDVVETGTIDYDAICLHTEWWASPVCFPDKSGYYRVYCSSYMDWEKGEWVWNKDKPKRLTKCGSDEVCECKTTWCDDDAMCHSKSLIYPTFPQIGLLEYTGTTDGLVASDGDGRWYHEYSRYRYPVGWERVFDLILPYYYNDAFIKYSGNVGNRTCNHQQINRKTNDRKLFETFNSPTSYRKTFEGYHKGRYIQKWELKNYDLDPWWEVYDVATYTYVYNKRTNEATPLNYEHYYKSDNTQRTDVRTYSYHRNVDDRIFDVVRYCDGVWLYSRRTVPGLDP